MAVSLKHAFTSAKVDGGDATLVKPSDWNAEHTLTAATDTLLGRVTAGTGAIEEITCTSFARSILDDANEATFKATVNLEIGTDVQAYDADLTTWAGLTPSANAQSLVTAADYAAMRALLDLEAGTDFLSPAAISAAYQPLDADLTTIAGLSSADSNFIVGSATGWVVESGATVRTSLGLGTADGPQFTVIELGHASDTTIARTGAGDISIEGNAVYRAGGTDIPVTDGGTGRSTGTTAYALVATGTTAEGAQQTLANGATTALLVGGGASALPVWTTATGSGAPVRGTSPTFTTSTLHPAGSQTDPSIAASGDPNTGFWFPTADTIAASTAGSERIRIDSGGNVGVNTTNTPVRFTLGANDTLGWAQSGTETLANLYRQSSSGSLVLGYGLKWSVSANGFASSYASSLAKSAIRLSNGSIHFYTDTAATTAVDTDVTPTERLRINSSGLVGINTTGDPAEELHVVGQGYFTAGAYIGSNANTNALIDDASNGAGTTTLYIGNVSITTSSDQRLKNSITNTTIDAVAKVQALRVVDFTWDDPSDTSWNNKNARGPWTGLIAQEAIQHVPWAVNAPRDPITMQPLPNAKDAAGNDQLWFMEYQQIVPVLIKAIQQQQAQISALEARMQALEG